MKALHVVAVLACLLLGQVRPDELPDLQNNLGVGQHPGVQTPVPGFHNQEHTPVPGLHNQDLPDLDRRHTNANTQGNLDVHHYHGTCSNPNSPTSVFYAIKTTGKDPYFERALSILASWGLYVQDRIGIFVDTADKKNNKVFRDIVGAGNVVEDSKCNIANYNKFGDAKTRPQRYRTKNVFQWFAEHGTQNWLCYVDDDMYVNVPHLERELKEWEKTCGNKCLIGDKGHLGHTMGVWCMTKQITRPVWEQINRSFNSFKGPDDVGLKNLVYKVTDVSVSDSLHFISQHSKLITPTHKINLKEPGYSNQTNLQDFKILSEMSAFNPATNYKTLLQQITAIKGPRWTQDRLGNDMLIIHDWLRSYNDSNSGESGGGGDGGDGGSLSAADPCQSWTSLVQKKHP